MSRFDPSTPPWLSEIHRLLVVTVRCRRAEVEDCHEPKPSNAVAGLLSFTQDRKVNDMVFEG